MLTSGFLTLRPVHLRASEEWVPEVGHYSFLFPKSGVVKYVAGPTSQRMGAGDVVIVKNEGGGKVRGHLDGESVLSVFSVTVEHLFPLFGANEISLLQNVFDALGNLKVFASNSPAAIESHRLLLDAPKEPNLRHRSHLLRVAATLLSEEFQVAHTHRSGFVRIEDHIIQVFETLSSEDILNLPVGELAARFNCSRRHLNRLFHQFFGFSVAAMKMEMRLLKAVSLLRNPDAKVINVAEQCGFHHLGLFNTCFKRRFGVSPGQWRKQSEQALAEPVTLVPENVNCPQRVNGLCPWSGDTLGSRLATPIPGRSGAAAGTAGFPGLKGQSALRAVVTPGFGGLSASEE